MRPASLPPTSLMQANYERIAGAFGCQGYLARSLDEVKKSVQSALAEKTRPSIINVFIEPSAGRVQQVRGRASLRSCHGSISFSRNTVGSLVQRFKRTFA